MRNNITVFDNINGELARHHLTKSDLANYLGIDRKTWRNWAKKGDLPASIVNKVSLLFDCSFDYLMRDVNLNESKPN